jgi:hypothetical protein
MSLVGGLSSHLQEDELTHLGAWHELQRLVGCIIDLQHLAVVDTRVHEASGDVNKKAKTSETRPPLCACDGVRKVQHEKNPHFSVSIIDDLTQKQQKHEDDIDSYPTIRRCQEPT